MAKTSETGHAKNVANFAQLVAICKSYGAIYQPSNPVIQLQGLSGVLVQAKDCLTSINSADAIFSNALSARGIVFNPFRKLITRIGSAVKSSGVSKQTKDQVAAFTIGRQCQWSGVPITTACKSLVSSNFLKSPYNFGF